MSEKGKFTREQEEAIKRTNQVLYLAWLFQQYAGAKPDSVAGLAAKLKSWQEDHLDAPLPEELAGFGEQGEKLVKQHRKEVAEGFDKLLTQALGSKGYQLFHRITDAAEALGPGREDGLSVGSTVLVIFTR